MTLDIFVNFNGNCKDAVEYYANIFGLEIPEMMTYKEVSKIQNSKIEKQDENRIIYTNLKIGSNNIMFSDCPSDMEHVARKQYNTFYWN